MAISLKNNSIIDIPQIYYDKNQNSIKIIDLSNNRLKEIPKITQFSNLIIINLDKNLIKTIGNEVFSQLRPELFSISNNLIESLSNDQISNWKTCLKVLNISYNQIYELDPPLFELTGLNTLYINNNKFTHVPTLFQKFGALRNFKFDWFKYTIPKLGIL